MRIPWVASNHPPFGLPETIVSYPDPTTSHVSNMKKLHFLSKIHWVLAKAVNISEASADLQEKSLKTCSEKNSEP